MSNVDFSWDDTGTGIPVLFVHGHPFDRSMWAPQVAALSSRYRCICPDLRGYGSARVPDTITRLDELATDLHDLLDHLDVQRAVVVGLSMGGQVAMAFAGQYPDSLLGIVLADTDARAETTASRMARYAMAERLEREGMQPYVDAELPKFLAPETFRSRPEVVAHMRRMMEHTNPMGAARVQRGRAERPDYCGVLQALSVPGLVIVGEGDFFTPVSVACDTAACLHRAAVEIIAESGHMPNLENPIAFNRCLERFLSGLPGQAPSTTPTGGAEASGVGS